VGLVHPDRYLVPAEMMILASPLLLAEGEPPGAARLALDERDAKEEGGREEYEVALAAVPDAEPDPWDVWPADR